MAFESPFFLTKEVAEKAINTAVATAWSSLPIKRKMLHVVVLGPKLILTEDRTWPNYQIEPHCIAQVSFGKDEKWPHPFDEIAQCKTLQLWQGRNAGGTYVMPHLLFHNDTPFWGGVWRDGLAVGCSGDQPHIDRAIAGMTADICIALAYEAYTKWIADNPKADFLF